MKYYKTIIMIILLLNLIGCNYNNNEKKVQGINVTKPVITLIGKASVTVTQGQSYIDAGAKAIDKEDGDITNNIETNNTVDVDRIGTYTITYNVKDSDNMQATEVKRVVHVISKSRISKPTIYEDAEDGEIKGWSVDNAHNHEVTLINSYDSEKSSRVIQFNSSSIYDSYRFRFPSEDTKNSVLKWSMKYNAKLYSFSVFVRTTKGERILMYEPKDTGNGMSGNTIVHGLGSNADDGEWHTHIRDLSVDLKRYEADNEIVSVQGLLLYGSGSIDDIELYENAEGLDVTVPVEVTAPGIVLTFDDSIIDDWYAMRDTFREKGVVATFFCYKWAKLSKETVAKFRELQNDGHEIGFHTVDHLGTYDGKFRDKENKAQAYFDDQIIPGITAMRNDNFDPKSFSYPYISGQPKHSKLIRQELPHIREFFSSVVQIDNAAEHSLEDIKKELLRVKNNKDIGVFLAHKILPEANPDPYIYRISTEKLIAIIDEANRLGLKFYTLEEAHRVYINQ